MKEPPPLPPKAWFDLAAFFDGSAAQLPKTGSYKPDYDGTEYDLDDVYRDARQTATGSRAEVSQLVADRKTLGAWPKGRYRAKFWLKARWEVASDYAKYRAKALRCSATQFPTHLPTDVQRAKGWLLWDGWDELLVDLWLAENMEFYARFDHTEGHPETFVDYSNWLREIRAGHYIKK